jgi:enoyl-[acyl-carrier protein] reductase II
VDLPLIAAGGICDARSMAASVVLGAEGVQMGTRILASRESPVHANLKDVLLAAADTDTLLLSVPGLPTMRVIRTAATERLAADPGGSALGQVLDLYFGGDMDAAVATIGQVASRITTVEPVERIIRDIWSGCAAELARAMSAVELAAAAGRSVPAFVRIIAGRCHRGSAGRR